MKLQCITVFLFLFGTCTISHAQQTKFPGKIRVILLGTFHYGETSDRNKTSFPDLFSPKRQSELNHLVEDINKLTPNKVFVEAPDSSQPKIDSLFGLYLNNALTDTVVLKNEIEQVGFRLAKLSKLPAPVCADFKQELPYDKMEAFEKGIGADSTIKYPPFFSIDYPFTDSTKKLSLKKMTLPQYYVALNDIYHRQQFQFDYLHYALGYGYKEDYTGTEYTASWYDRNLKIYTNVLRNLEPSDKVIVVLFGASHTNTLRQFFENHPAFEIIELDKVITP